MTNALRELRTILCSLSKSGVQAGLLGLQELGAPCKVGMRVSGGLCEDKIKPLLAHTAWRHFSQPGPLHTVGVQQIFTDWGGGGGELVKSTGGCKKRVDTLNSSCGMLGLLPWSLSPCIFIPEG